MFKPNFEDPNDTAKQLIKNNITVFDIPGSEYWAQFLANSPIPEYQTLSKTMIIPNDWDEWDNLIEHSIIGKGTHAYMSHMLSAWRASLGRWWKGNLVLGNYPYGGYLSDKKWYLNEEFDIFIFSFCY